MFVEWGHRKLHEDWPAAEALADRALELDAGHGPARNLRAQALDKKRDEIVGQHASQARRLQAAGDIEAALAEVHAGLKVYPADPRLRAILDALTKESDRRRGRTGEVEAPVSAGVRTDRPVPAIARSGAIDETRVSQASQVSNVASDADDMMETRAAPPPAQPRVTAAASVAPATPHPAPQKPKSAASASPVRARRPSPRVWQGVMATAAVAGLVGVGLFFFNDRGAEEAVPLSGALPDDDAPAVAPTVAGEPAVPADNTALATLTVRQLPPGTRVSVDNAPVGTVGTDGRLSYTSVKPGRHTLQFSRESYDPVTITREFSASAPVLISPADFTFKAASILVEFVADAGTNVAVSQGDQTLHQFTGPAKLPLAEGTYQVVARGPANLPTSETLELKAGESRTIDLRNVASGMEPFETGGWTQADTWFTRRGGGFVLYKRTAPRARIAFTVKPDRSRNPFSSGPRVKWVVAFQDVRNHLLAELDDEYLYRTEVVGGARRELPRVPHRIPSNGQFVHLSVEVSDTQVVHQYNAGSGWQVIDTWTRATPEARFGFYLPGSETLEVSNFRYDSLPR